MKEEQRRKAAVDIEEEDDLLGLWSQMETSWVSLGQKSSLESRFGPGYKREHQISDPVYQTLSMRQQSCKYRCSRYKDSISISLIMETAVSSGEQLEGQILAPQLYGRSWVDPHSIPHGCSLPIIKGYQRRKCQLLCQ